jgi:hypothetical protein
MTEKTFPARFESLTSEWLTQVLRANGVLKGGAVSGFSGEPMRGAYTSSVFRLLLEYQRDVVGAPRSVVVKFHSSSASIRDSFENLGIYEKEVRFYQILGQDRSLPIPNCYSAEFDEESGDFVLLMEDMSAARSSSEDDVCGDIRIALLHLAKIHAKFWGDPQLTRHDWIVQTTDLNNPPPLKGLWATNLAQVKKRFRDQLSAYTWSVCDKWLEYWDEIMLCMSQDTHTLVHTDAHLGQMLFPTSKLQRFVLIDWQYPSKSWGAEDVAHLIVSELSVESRRKHEASLIDFYYDALCKFGVFDLTKDRFWFQCKLSLLWLHFMYFKVVAEPEMLQTLKVEAQEYGEDWREWVFGMLGSATEDWQLVAILDQAIEETPTGKATPRC